MLREPSCSQTALPRSVCDESVSSRALLRTRYNAVSDRSSQQHPTGSNLNFQQLKAAIRIGDLPEVKRIIGQEPALLHARDPSEWEELTALHCAARYARLDIAKLLVERGSEVYSHPHNSYPPVFIASQYRFHSDRPNGKTLVDYFINEIPEKAEGTLGTGATIHIAARLGFTHVVAKHLAKDPLAVHQRGWLGDTPLHWSCHNGHVEIVEMLLDAGADIEADEINCYGGKPLHWASEHEVEVVKLLLERGANVDSINQLPQSNYFGVTPLLMNAHQNDDCCEVTKLLLDAGANPDAKHNGKTALEIAEEKGHHSIANVLSALTRSAQPAAQRVIQRRRPPELPERPEDGHKGTFGSVLVVAGSRGMAGAASLAGQGALHSGTGLVTVATPTEVMDNVAMAHPSYMTLELNESVLEFANHRAKAVALGPGLGSSPKTQEIVHLLYRESRIPVVLDADGINAFQACPPQLAERSSNAARILTPHPGEFARLTGMTTAQINNKRQELAVAFAKKWKITLLLKGSETIITDGIQLAVNTTGSSALATGGSGDVLTGLIAGLVAQGMSAFEAAHLGAHIHGLAGELAADKYSSRYTTSAEILEQIAAAWKTF